MARSIEARLERLERLAACRVRMTDRERAIQIINAAYYVDVVNFVPDESIIERVLPIVREIMDE